MEETKITIKEKDPSKRKHKEKHKLETFPGDRIESNSSEIHTKEVKSKKKKHKETSSGDVVESNIGKIPDLEVQKSKKKKHKKKLHNEDVVSESVEDFVNPDEMAEPGAVKAKKKKHRKDSFAESLPELISNEITEAEASVSKKKKHKKKLHAEDDAGLDFKESHVSLLDSVAPKKKHKKKSHIHNDDEQQHSPETMLQSISGLNVQLESEALSHGSLSPTKTHLPENNSESHRKKKKLKDDVNLKSEFHPEINNQPKDPSILCLGANSSSRQTGHVSEEDGSSRKKKKKKLKDFNVNSEIIGFHSEVGQPEDASIALCSDAGDTDYHNHHKKKKKKHKKDENKEVDLGHAGMNNDYGGMSELTKNDDKEKKSNKNKKIQSKPEEDVTKKYTPEAMVVKKKKKCKDMTSDTSGFGTLDVENKLLSSFGDNEHNNLLGEWPSLHVKKHKKKRKRDNSLEGARSNLVSPIDISSNKNSNHPSFPASENANIVGSKSKSKTENIADCLAAEKERASIERLVQNLDVWSENYISGISNANEESSKSRQLFIESKPKKKKKHKSERGITSAIINEYSPLAEGDFLRREEPEHGERSNNFDLGSDFSKEKKKLKSDKTNCRKKKKHSESVERDSVQNVSKIKTGDPGAEHELHNLEHERSVSKIKFSDPSYDTLDMTEIPVEFKIPPLHAKETCAPLSIEEKEKLKLQGIKMRTGVWTKVEMSQIVENWLNFSKRFRIMDPCALLGVNFKGKKLQQIKNFNKAKHFYVRLAKGLGDRPLYSVYRKARILLDPRKNSGKLSPEDVSKLKFLRELHGSDWSTISELMDRPSSQLHSAFRNHKDGRATGKWTKEEEKLLKHAVKNLGKNKKHILSPEMCDSIPWKKISKAVGTRTPYQCREHWFNSKKLREEKKGYVKWSDLHKVILIYLMYHKMVSDERLVDWRSLYKAFKDCLPSYKPLAKHWYRIKRHYLKDYKTKSHEEIVTFLYEKCLPLLLNSLPKSLNDVVSLLKERGFDLES